MAVKLVLYSWLHATYPFVHVFAFKDLFLSETVSSLLEAIFFR